MEYWCHLLRICSHIERYNVIELLYHSSYDTNPGFLAYSCSLEVYWSRSESSWYAFYFLAKLVVWFEATIELGRKSLKMVWCRQIASFQGYP